MDFVEYIKPELLVLIPVLYLIGFGIKKSNIKDHLIPLILGGISVFLAAIYVLASTPLPDGQAVATAIFTAITQGVLCAGASVFTDQIIKQIQKGD